LNAQVGFSQNAWFKKARSGHGFPPCPEIAPKTTSAPSRTPKERAGKERGYFEDANNPAAFYTTRRQNEADVKFCWK
jgi:hypothetical protein